MKILYLVTTLVPAGAERIVYALATGLDKRQFETGVICISAVRGDVGKWLQQQGIPVWFLDIDHKWEIHKLWSLLHLLRRLRPQILHAHLFHANILARLFGNITGIPVVLSTVHTMEKRWRPWHFWLDKWTSHWNTMEICVSESVAKFTSQRTHISATKIKVITNGIAWQKFATHDAKLQPFEGRLIIGAVGRLVTEKGFSCILSALPTIVSSLPTAILVIVGDGPLRQDLQNLARRLGIDQYVKWLGFQNETAPFYSMFDIFVCPSLFEGFGLTLIEAMAAGCPVIASDIEPFREIIACDQLGILVAPNACDEWSAAAIALLKNPARRQQMAGKAQQLVQQRFSLSRMISEYQNLYHEIYDSMTFS